MTKLIGGIRNVVASRFVVYSDVTRGRQEGKHHELLMKIYCLNRGIRRISQESYKICLVQSYSGADLEIFDRRGPESREDHVFNAGRAKPLCELRREGTHKSYIEKYVRIKISYK